MNNLTKFLLFLVIFLIAVNAELRRSKNAHKQQLLASEIVNNGMKINLKSNISVEKKLNLMNFIEEQKSLMNKKNTYIKREFNLITKKIEKSEQTISPENIEMYKSMIETNEPHELSLTNHRNTFYTGDVQVGSKDMSFRMIFDTGSIFIFLNSIKCQHIGCVRGNQFDPSSSPTFKDVKLGINSEFGSGTIAGDMAIDTFFIADIEVKRVEFFEITDQKGKLLEQGDFDGLIGLAFPVLGQGSETIVDYLKEQDLIEKKVFSFYLTREDESEESFVSFGVVDHDVVDGEITYHKVESPIYWSVMAEEIRFGGEDTGLCSKEKRCALAIDSGTSVIAGPSKDVSQLAQKMLEGGYQCNQISEMPSLSFVIDGEEYVLLAEEYIISTNGFSPSFYEHSENPRECVPALIPLDIKEPTLGHMWVLGDIFMSKYYTVFDREERQVGFAKLKGIDERFYDN